jgi:hypothetical protein
MVSLSNERDPRLGIEEQTTKMLLAANATLTPRLASCSHGGREQRRNSSQLESSKKQKKQRTSKLKAPCTHDLDD